MDLQVYLMIVVIFFGSLAFLLFINRHIQSGKTFEEALAEKRRLTEKLYGTNKKKKNASNKSNKKNRADKNSHESKQQKVIHSAVESDAKSNSGEDDEYASSSNEQNAKVHVEFTEADFIGPDSNKVEFKRQLSTGKLPQQPVRKISSTKSPGSGILVNKPTTAPKPAPPSNGSIESLNSFDKSHPKDDLEIKKHRDESLGRTMNNSKKDHKNAGKQNKKENSSPRPVEKVSNSPVDSVDAHLTMPVEAVASSAVAAVPKESPKNQANKEKANKKKRNDAILIQQLVDAGFNASSTSDAVNVNAIIKQLGPTELSRNEIQILIDFLLNKQQDIGNVMHADWSDDPVHKLRKQIEDKDRLLSEEQASTLAIQAKLRELRAEYNAERQHALQRHNAHIEEINVLKADLHQAQQDHQSFVDRATNEQQALKAQIQLLHQKNYQEKNSQTQENAQKLQQLTEANSKFTAELLTKNNVIQELQEKFLQIRDEHLKKMADYEQKVQDCARKAESDVAHLNSEIQRLHAECQRKDEIEKLLAMKKYEIEQLESRLAEHSKQSNQIEDSSKVEIRNLQNALDSTKTELQLSRNELANSAKRIGELNSQMSEVKANYDAENSTVVQKYTKQIEELNGNIQSYRSTISEKDSKLRELEAKLENVSADQREQELFKQIADYKDKNNELRKKNWKLVDALQKAQESAYKISSKCKLVTANSTLSPSKLSTSTIATSTSNDDNEHEYVLRTKEVFERLFPSVASNVDYDTWLQNLSSQIEQLQQQSQNCLKQKSNATTNHQQQNGDEDIESNEPVTGNGTENHYGQDNGVKLSPSTEELLLQNAQLKTTVDEYKTIVADTEGVLTILEKKVKEQDAYWRGIVQVKDNEISLLKENAVAST